MELRKHRTLINLRYFKTYSLRFLNEFVVKFFTRVFINLGLISKFSLYHKNKFCNIHNLKQENQSIFQK